MKTCFPLLQKTFLLILLSFASLNASESTTQPFVTGYICGQLGNEICQVASILAYSWDHGAQPYFPELNQNTWKISYNRDRFFFRLDASSPPRPIKNRFDEHEWWTYRPIPHKEDQYLNGIFFSWGYFHHHRDKLLEVFAPSQEVLSYLQKKYEWLLNQPNTVSVHVRTYNENCHATFFPFLGLEYYEKAMYLFPTDTIFVIFSDRINWCKHNFGKLKKNMVFIENNDHIQDFFLMSSMKGHIIANSSFSWWAAYLDNKPEKIVVAPRYFYKTPPTFILYPQKTKNNLLLPEWIQIEYNPNTAYPVDMKWYDIESQSIDTQ